MKTLPIYNVEHVKLKQKTRENCGEKSLFLLDAFRGKRLLKGVDGGFYRTKLGNIPWSEKIKEDLECSNE